MPVSQCQCPNAILHWQGERGEMGRGAGPLSLGPSLLVPVPAVARRQWRGSDSTRHSWETRRRYRSKGMCKSVPDRPYRALDPQSGVFTTTFLTPSLHEPPPKQISPQAVLSQEGEPGRLPLAVPVRALGRAPPRLAAPIVGLLPRLFLGCTTRGPFGTGQWDGGLGVTAPHRTD